MRRQYPALAKGYLPNPKVESSCPAVTLGPVQNETMSRVDRERT